MASISPHKRISIQLNNDENPFDPSQNLFTKPLQKFIIIDTSDRVLKNMIPNSSKYSTTYTSKNRKSRQEETSYLQCNFNI